MEVYKQPLKEVLLFAGFQLIFTFLYWVILSEKSFLLNCIFAIPIASLAMAFTIKKHKWYVSWIKYLVSGALMVLLSIALYYLEEKYLIGFLGDLLSAIISGIWNFFPGVLKLIASVLILLVILAVSALFFAVFFLVILIGNVIFSMWVLPKFDALIEEA